MKLLLTSGGFDNPKIGQAFLKLVGKSANEIKLIFVPTASEAENYKDYIQDEFNDYIALGLNKQNIKTLRIDHTINYSEVENFDAMHVCGGNTFYLLKKVREFDFDKIIRKFVKEGNVYVGLSAGSYIACPTIEMASWKHQDRNRVGLKDFTALNFVPFLITAHYEPKYKTAVDAGEASSKYKVKRLTDRQAISMVDEKVKLIE